MNSNPGVSAPGVMIVYDDMFIAELAVSCCESIGLSAKVVQSSAELGEVMAQPSILVLLDLTMPDVDPVDVMRMMAECQPSVPLLFFSGAAPERIAAAHGVAKLYGIRVIGSFEKQKGLGELREVLLTFVNESRPA